MRRRVVAGEMSCQEQGMRVVYRHAAVLWIGLLLLNGPAMGQVPTQPVLPESIIEAQRLSGRADVLASAGREREAAQLYFEAHLKFQTVIEEHFDIGLRASLKGSPATEEAVVQEGRVVSELRDVNLNKLWVVLDPDDRAHERMLEDERSELVRRFPEFTSPLSDEPLQEFLLRLYPEEAGGSRQLETLRQGRLPASARWARLENRRESE